MTPSIAPPEPSRLLPDPDLIRSAITATDERARLLRRLLRLALQLRLHLTTGDEIGQAEAALEKGVSRG